MAEQKKDMVPPKIPPPPPPRARTPKNQAAASLLESTSPPSNPGATANKASPTSPPERQPKIRRPAPTPPDLSEAAKLLSSTSPPSSKPPKPPVVQPFGPRHPPVNMNPAGRDSPTPKSPRSAANIPRKGFFQNVCSRTKDLFTRKKTTTYEPLPKQPAPFAASPPTSPPKRGGFFRSLFDPKSTTTTTTTTPIRLDDTTSDTESSMGRSHSGGDRDYPRFDDLNQSDDLESSGSPPRVASFAEDTGSDISASDLEEAEALRPPVSSCRILEHREDQLLSIQVNTPADIRVTATVTGKVTTCVRTATKKGRK